MRLGWGTESGGRRTDFEIITAQPQLMEAFPELRALASVVDVRAPFDRILFEWCAFQLVPLRQFPAGQLFVIYYEDLLVQPERELPRLFAHVGRDAAAGVPAAFEQPSATSLLSPGAAASRDPMRRWLSELSGAQIERAQSMLAQCGLDAMYGPDDMPG